MGELKAVRPDRWRRRMKSFELLIVPLERSGYGTSVNPFSIRK